MEYKWVVSGEKGVYSDRSVWVVCVVESKEEGEQYILELNKYLATMPTEFDIWEHPKSQEQELWLAILYKKFGSDVGDEYTILSQNGDQISYTVDKIPYRVLQTIKNAPLTQLE